MLTPSRFATRPWFLACAALLLVGASSCSKLSASVADDDDDASAAAADSSSAPRPTDANLLAYLMAANNAEISDGDLASTHAVGTDVKSFADSMVQDHTSANRQAEAVAQKSGIAPKENAATRQLTTSSDNQRDALRAMQGVAFDRAYMDGAIRAHQAMLDALDRELIPKASNARVRAFLVGLRPTVARHLAHAQAVRSVLGG